MSDRPKRGLRVADGARLRKPGGFRYTNEVPAGDRGIGIVLG